MDNVRSQRSPEKVKDHDRDLRRVRQLQQLQAEQDAKLNAEELKKRKEERMQEEKAQAKKRTAAINKTKSGTSSLSMNSFTTPSYRCVFNGGIFFVCVFVCSIFDCFTIAPDFSY